jgi:integrase
VGKGRKLRCTPLLPDVAVVLKQWSSLQAGKLDDPLFPSSRGGPLSADAVQRLVSRHVKSARRVCPSLAAKRVTPHTLRHAAAMALLHRGVDLSVIALWLATSRRKQLRSTYTRTCNSKNELLPMLTRLVSFQTASVLRTRC